MTTTMQASPKKTLWDIGQDLMALHDLLNEVEGDITNPEVAAAVEEFFAQIERDEARKLDGYIAFIKRTEMEVARDKGLADLLKMELADTTRKVQSGENRISYLKDRIKQYLKATGRTKAETESGRILAIQCNGGKFPIIWDEKVPSGENIPPQFRKVTLDTDKVYEALTEGAEVPFAKLGVRGDHVRIK